MQPHTVLSMHTHTRPCIGLARQVLRRRRVTDGACVLAAQVVAFIGGDVTCGHARMQVA